MSLIATLAYNTDLFETASIGRMLRHFKMLLESRLRISRSASVGAAVADRS